jgi:hypothetical protein
MDAIREAAANPPDAVLLDLGMPGLSGYDLARYLGGEGPERLRLVALTGLSDLGLLWLLVGPSTNDEWAGRLRVVGRVPPPPHADRATGSAHTNRSANRTQTKGGRSSTSSR